MFTGLVTDVGKIVDRLPDVDPNGDREESWPDDGLSFWIATDLETSTVEIGESIAVDGACLTVTECRDGSFRVDAAPETLQKTTLGRRQVGDGVHLERALRVGDRLGGHFVQGHVDGVGELRERRADGEAWELVFQAPRAVARFLVEKGSVAVDGVSLTPYDVGDLTFTVTVVPHTARETKLADYRPGHTVNLEADMLGKYVDKLVGQDDGARDYQPTSSRH